MAEEEKSGQTDSGQGTEEKPRWQELGYNSEQDFIDSALSWQQKAEQSESLQKELQEAKRGRDKLATDYQKRSTEIGTLKQERDRLQEQMEKMKLGNNKQETSEEQDSQNEQDANSQNESQKQQQTVNPGEILDSLTEEEAQEIDALLDKEENKELKTKVAAGGEQAMAEMISAIRSNKPVDLSKPLFSGYRKKKNAKVTKKTIQDEVSALFKKEDKASIPTYQRGAMNVSQSQSSDNKQLRAQTADSFLRK